MGTKCTNYNMNYVVQLNILYIAASKYEIINDLLNVFGHTFRYAILSKTDRSIVTDRNAIRQE